MCDGYNAAGEDDHPELEDEFLCEYVDGTMDPVVREVFEEYVRANPDLKDHIDCLRHTRLLLCRYGCRCRAPRDLHDRIRREITCDLVNGRVPFHILVSDRLKGAASFSSAMALLLLIGLLAGVTLVSSADQTPAMVSAAVVTSQSSAVAASDQQVTFQPSTVMRTPGLSPRHEASLHGTRPSLVATGLENELNRGTQPSYTVAFGSPSAFP